MDQKRILALPERPHSYARWLGAISLPLHPVTLQQPTRAQSARHAAHRARVDGWEGEGGSVLASRGPKLPL